MTAPNDYNAPRGLGPWWWLVIAAIAAVAVGAWLMAPDVKETPERYETPKAGQGGLT